MVLKRVVLYGRYSTDQQSRRSCADQERETHTGLPRYGVDPTDALVIHDEAQSGTKADREGFLRIVDMARRGEISVLAVDDMSRLSRGDNVYAFIKDLVFQGGRFIATTEGIDTNNPGWEMLVRMKEMHNSQILQGLKIMVARGQKGCVLNDDSTGDSAYGYESFYRDLDWEKKLVLRGPSLKKGLRICEAEAQWVRKIFAWFVEGLSFHKIAHRLVVEGAPVGTRARSKGWGAERIRRIVRNKKYIGVWSWGETSGISNSTGKKKRIRVDSGKVTVRERPELRIIEQPIWDSAQARIAMLKEKYAHTGEDAGDGQKPPKNPAAVHPRTLLGGAMTCALCGAPMWMKHARNQRYYYCSGHVKGICSATFVVDAKVADKAVLSALTGLVADWPVWIQEVSRRLLRLLEEQVTQMPSELANGKRRLAQLKPQIERLVDSIADGTANSARVASRLEAAEREESEIENRLRAWAEIQECSMKLPDEQWMKDQLGQWSDRLSESESAMIAVREALESLTAEAIVPPGKKRGYVKLQLRVNSWGLLLTVMGTKLPSPLRSLLPHPVHGEASPTIELILGGPTAIDKWMPDVIRWRGEGVTWEEIARRTGLIMSSVFNAWKKYHDAYE